MSKLPLDPATATAEQVIALMTEIWNDDPQDLYDEWHNALEVMRALGAKRTAGPTEIGPNGLITFQLKSGEKLHVAVNGGCIDYAEGA